MGAYCEMPKKFFENEESVKNDRDISKITSQIQDIIVNSEEKNVDTLANSIKSILFDQDSNVNTDTNDKRFDTSMQALGKYLGSVLSEMDIDNSLKQSLISQLKPEELSAYLIGKAIPVVEQEETPYMEDNENMQGEKERLKETKDSIIESFYSYITNGNVYRQREFNLEFVNSILTTKGQNGLTRVRTTRDLNIAIIKLKNKWFKLISDFVKANYEGDFTDVMFDSNGNVVSSHIQVLNKFYNLVQKYKEDGSLELKVQNGWANAISYQDTANSQFFHVLNAYVNLVYFDSIIQSLDNTVSLKHSYMSGTEYNLNDGKYEFGKNEANKRKGYQNSEQRNADKDLGAFPKLVLSSIPIISYGRETRETVSLQLLMYAWTQLLDARFDKLPAVIKEALLNAHGDLNEYQKIFQEIAKPERRQMFKEAGVSQKAYDVLYSVAKKVYDQNNPESYYNVEKSVEENDPTPLGYSLVDTVSAALNRSRSVTYGEYVYNRELGIYQYRTKRKYALRKDQFNIKNNINNSIVSIPTSQRKIIRDKWNFKQALSDSDSNAKTWSGFKITLSDGTVLTIENPKGATVLDSSSGSLSFNSENKPLHEILTEYSKYIALDDLDVLNAIIKGTSLNEHQRMFRDILEYVDDYLGTDFLTIDGLNTIKVMTETDLGNTVIKQLLTAASKSQIVNELYYQFELAVQDQTQEQYQSILDFYTFLSKEYVGFSKANLTDSKFIKEVGRLEDGIFQLFAVRQKDLWVDSFAKARAIVRGAAFKSTINDLSKNKVPNTRVSFLGGNISYYINKYKRQTREAINKELTYFEGSSQFTSLLNLIKDSNRTQKTVYGINIDDLVGSTEWAKAYNLIERLAEKDGTSKTQALVKYFNDNGKGHTAQIMKIVVEAMELGVNATNWSLSKIQMMLKTLTDEYSGIAYNVIETLEGGKELASKIRGVKVVGQSFNGQLLFANNDIIEDFVINTDSSNRNKRVKQVKKMTAPELFYSSIFGNFYSTYYRSKLESNTSTKSKNPLVNTVLIQPTTYSDKVTLIQYAINVNKKLNTGKSIWECNSDELIDLYLQTIGNSYKNLYNKVIDDYSKIIGRPVTVQDINDYLNSGRKIHEIAREFFDAGMEFQENTYYTKINGKYVFNPLLEYYANDLFASKENLARRFQQLKMEFVNELINSGVNFFLNGNYEGSETEIAKIIKEFVADSANTQYSDELEFKSDWVRNGKLIIAKQNGQAVKWDLLTSVEGIELNPLLEKFFYTESLLANNLRLELTGTEIGHPIKAKVNYNQELTTLGITTDNGDPTNPFLNLRNKKGKPKIIFGHPAIGKTWVKQNNPKLGNLFIDWDDEFNVGRNKWIKEYIEKNGEKLPGETAEIKKQNILINPYQTDNDGNLIYKEYVDFLESEWTRIKNKAQREGKVLLVSPHFLLRNHASEFDAIIDMDYNQFITKDVDRGNSKTLENAKGWKKGIDESITHAQTVNPELQTYMIQQGETLLSLLNDADQTVSMDHIKDINWLREHAASDPRLQALYYKLMQQYESVAQGAQLKRNVIIPATLQYLSLGVRQGVRKKVKVAVIEDEQSEAFNFRGEVNSGLDSRDGSADINMLETIAENQSLENQEVGFDRKPIWHHFNPNLGTASLVKFAAFTDTSERMRHLLSKSSAYRKFKKMNDSIKWDDSIDLAQNIEDYETTFFNDILKKEELCYIQDGTYYKIIDFGRDDFGYYTIECKTNELADISGTRKKVYHKFNSKGEHLKFRYDFTKEDGDYVTNTEENLEEKFQGLDDINTLFKLYNVLGGIYTVNRSTDANGDVKFVFNNKAAFATSNFMNTVVDEHGDQVLKDCMISYLINKSAFKNGAANINPESAWSDNSKLMYIELDTDGIGPQMDADHTIDEAELTEFSQVIAALEAGGRLHHLTKRVYNILGNLALEASRLEIDAAARYIQARQKGNLNLEQIKNYIYDIVGRAMITNYRPIEGRTDLSQSIMSELKRTFNFTEDHSDDAFWLPLSDSNIYQQAVIEFISQINKKSIKRKYPGSGCVMVPGYNTMMTYKYDGKIAMFQDVFNEARSSAQSFDESKESYPSYQIRVVQEFLKGKQEALYQNAPAVDTTVDTELTSAISRFIPTDIVDIVDANNNHICTITLDSIYDYYTFKGYKKGQNWDKKTIFDFILQKNREQHPESTLETLPTNLKFVTNVTNPRNLAPARITFSYTDVNGRQVDTNVFDTEEVRNSFLYGQSPERRQSIQQMFDNLDKGLYHEHKVFNLQNKAAELIVSNMYASKFGTQNASMKEILEQGPSYFAQSIPNLIQESNYAMAFINFSGENTYISFSKPRVNDEDARSVKEISWGNTKTINGNVFCTDKNGTPLFQIGYLLQRPDLDLNGDEIVNHDTGEVIRDKKYKKYKGGVYEYIQFATKYKAVQSRSSKISGNTIIHIDVNAINAFKTAQNQAYKAPSFTSTLISKLFTDSGAATVMLNENLNIKSAQILKHLQPFFKSANIANGDLSRAIDCINNDAVINKKKSDLLNDNRYNEYLTSTWDRLAKEVFASFERSRYYIASRIPAQTLQSFMQMEAVAFTDTTKNVAYVSHWQTW